MLLRSRFRIYGLNRKFNRAAHVMGPTLIALAFAGVSNVAHAQGTMDSGLLRGVAGSSRREIVGQ
jgi:hypothetical protein